MDRPAPVIGPPGPKDLSSSLRRNIHALSERRRQEMESASRQEKVAHAITRFAGSMVFAYIHLVIYGVWILVNLDMVPGWKSIDPSFGLLGTSASVEAIFLATFVLVSQNRTEAAADKRADLDLHISLLTEHELTKVAKLLGEIALKLEVGAEAGAELEEAKQDVAPEAVLDALTATRERAG